MSSLGELYFQLGLDSDKFDKAIEEAKKKVASLQGSVTIDVKTNIEELKKSLSGLSVGSITPKVNLAEIESSINKLKSELSEVEKGITKATNSRASNAGQRLSKLMDDRTRIESEIAQLENLKKQSSTKPTPVKVELDNESFSLVKARLQLLESPITPKITIEYDTERFNAVTQTLKNYAESLNNIGKIKLGIDDSFLRRGVSENQKGFEKIFGKVSNYLFGDDIGDSNKNIQTIQKILDSHPFKISVTIDRDAMIASLNKSMKSVPLKLDVDVADLLKKLKALKIPLAFNVSQAISEAKAALRKTTFDAKLNLVIDKAKISKVIKEAFAKKGLEYQATPGDVRNARILEIQQRMENAQKKFNKQMNKSVSSTGRLGSSMKNASSWAGQLSNQFNNFISIYTLERFIRNLYTIGGEFQKQRIALQNMIGDADRANAVFERMKDLSVKSPFTFSELASYTKQMSAYGIEYEEIYDTTKRLADISAGVGVDMSRIILAYGQVRSAAVLRGQELRQFTEAGIPLVRELAKSFAEIEGRAITTGEVFDKISKREVSFDMVKDILFDMTDPGERFFETQERLAESLAGKWSNLKDAWDIMIADIANGMNGPLSFLAETLTAMTNNWRNLGPIILGVVTALGVYKMALEGVAIVQGIVAAFKGPGGWISLLAGALAGAGIGMWAFKGNIESAADEANRLNSELEKSKSILEDDERTANRYLDTIAKSAKREEDKYELYKKQEAAFKELKELYPDVIKAESIELMTLEEIARVRKQIADQTRLSILEKYDDNIENAELRYLEAKAKLDATTKGLKFNYGKDFEKRLAGEAKANYELIKSEANAALEIYNKAMNAKKAYEQSLIDKNKPKPRDAWMLTADEVIAKYPNVNIRKASEESIYTYFDYLEGVFKEAKEKYDRTTTDALRTPQKAIMDAVNAVNMAIGGRSFYDEKKKKGGSSLDEQAKLDINAYIEALKREISEQSQKWNLFKELMDATGDKKLSMKVAFDDSMEFVSPFLTELKERIQEEAKKLGVNISVKDLLGLGEKQLMTDERIPKDNREKAAKALGTLIEAYHSENKRLKNDTIKDFVEILTASKDFAKQIEDIERELQEGLAALSSMYGKDTPQYQEAANELIKRAEEDKTKVQFEEFKESSDWVKVFDDLDRVSDATLDNMISKIEKFAKQARRSEEVTKQLVEAMGKLRDESIERNPLEGFKDAWSRRKYYQSLKGRVGEYDEDGKLITQKMVDDGLAEANEDLKDSALAVADKFQAVANASDLLSGLFENMGINMDGFLGVISGLVGGTASGAQAGAGIAAAFGAAGPWGAIAGAAVGMLSSVFAMHDKALQKEIEASEAREKAIKNLSDHIESILDRNLGGLYTMKIDSVTDIKIRQVVKDYERLVEYMSDLQSLDADQLRWVREYSHLSEDTIKSMRDAMEEDSYFDAQLALLKLQRDEVMKQRSLEEDKKNTDKSKIADYDVEIAELEQSIKNLAEDLANELYGIDFKGWANQLAESLVDAWASGEDAVLAYKNKVNDILRDVGVSVISQKILEPLLQSTMDSFLAQFEKDNGKLTENSMNILAGMYNEAEYAASATEAYLEGLKKLGIDVAEKGTEASDSVSKGIQSITESQADLLSSYVNSLRQDVSVKRSLIEKLVGDDIPRMSFIAEAQLRELNQIVANTKRNADAADKIYDLVNRVVDKGSNKLKV